MERSLKTPLCEALGQKIVLLTGPRQCGKTTLSKFLYENCVYFNYDIPEDRVELRQQRWDRTAELIIFDELHKQKNWKSWIKGVYDRDGARPKILVTGSAKLDLARKVGDSLAGRFFQYRLHPFDIKELKEELDPEESLARLLKVGGFPEPFFKNDENFYRLWRKSHSDIILRQDMLDLESPRNISAIETLVEMLRSRVGSGISYANLAADLEVDPKTIKRWIAVLENLYIIFTIRPYSKKISRSILKQPKIYFYDSGMIKGDTGAKLENIVACALLKELHFIEDTLGYETSLNYLSLKGGVEVDFIPFIEQKPVALIEVKATDVAVSKGLSTFAKIFPKRPRLQLVANLQRDFSYPDGTKICNLARWLADIKLVD